MTTSDLNSLGVLSKYKIELIENEISSVNYYKILISNE